MRLVSVTIQKFRNITAPQTVSIQSNVTCLVGKNESGKTTVLEALHRLNPAGNDASFNLVTDYPRWLLSKDRRREPNLEDTKPVEAVFDLTETDIQFLRDEISPYIPNKSTLSIARSYNNKFSAKIQFNVLDLLGICVSDADIHISTSDKAALKSAPANFTGLSDSIDELINKKGQEKGEDNTIDIEQLSGLKEKFSDAYRLLNSEFDATNSAKVLEIVPQFFYFSDISQLPGKSNLSILKGKKKENVSPSDRTVLSLLSRTQETIDNFLQNDYESRTAELQSAALEITQEVFKYWTQNKDLKVKLDVDTPKVAQAQRQETYLRIELEDERHGGITTNFETRSSGFRWFFSFFVAFYDYQESDKPVVVLLDEPGTSLHGEAQKNFVDFIYNELGAKQQTVYTTHSQFMIDPEHYEDIRAVQDRATREDHDKGVEISPIRFNSDRETVLPLESALGYSISQNLFIGRGPHLVVEGGSDLIYLMRMSTHFESIDSKKQDLIPLSPRFSIIPAGSANNIPTYVALLGKRLRVHVLIDGSNSKKLEDRTLAAVKANSLNANMIVKVSDVDDVSSTGDIEDLFDIADYLRLYNWAFNKSLAVDNLPKTTEPILRKIETIEGQFNHLLPASALTEHKDEFFATISKITNSRFSDLFSLLNSSLES